MTAKKLGEILSAWGIIDTNAVDDPINFDEGRTMRQLENALPNIKDELCSSYDEMAFRVEHTKKLLDLVAWQLKIMSGVTP